MMKKPDLITLEDAKALPVEAVADLFAKHLNPGQLHFMKLLGFHKVLVQKAEGMYYVDQHGRRILDFFGGFGSLAPGHNHPRILAARKLFQDEGRHELGMAFMSQYATALARNLAKIAPEDLEIAFLCVSGSEANEAATKLAERAAGADRRIVAYTTNSFHGKTRAALSMTDSAFYQDGFELLPNVRRVPYGDIDALEALFRAEPGIGVFMLETVQGGGGIILPPEGYLKAVRELCDRHKVIWIADEVQCGYGRTGRFFAFEHWGVVPDIITLAKSLGGGKTALGAYIARSWIHEKAYGKPKTALIHGPATFAGMGEACATGIEALNLLYDENLIENSAERGEQLLAGLKAIQQKHPKLIKEVRGRGLMVGIEFNDLSATLPFGVSHLISVLDDKLKGSLCGFVGALLLRDYDTLVAFTEYNRNVIRLEPPLIVTAEEVDLFLKNFDDLLSRGVTGIIKDYIKATAANRAA